MGWKKKNFNKAMDRVLREIEKKDKKWISKKITARFVCALTLYWPNGKSKNSIGKVEGYISKKKLGKNGFGYDPIFIPKNSRKTFSEIETGNSARIPDANAMSVAIGMHQPSEVSRLGLMAR